jgi:peroxiredoxin
MSYLAGAVIVIAGLTVLNLVLTMGTIRRLKEHAEQINRSAGLTPVTQPLPKPGSRVADFTAVTTDGARVSRDLLASGTVVGFFSPRCTPCAEQLPEFVESVSNLLGGRSKVLAVVAGEPAEAHSTVTTLEHVAQVVIEDHAGPVARAFGALATPAFCLVDAAGHIAVASTRVAELTTQAVA